MKSTMKRLLALALCLVMLGAQLGMTSGPEADGGETVVSPAFVPEEAAPAEEAYEDIAPAAPEAEVYEEPAPVEDTYDEPAPAAPVELEEEAAPVEEAADVPVAAAEPAIISDFDYAEKYPLVMEKGYVQPDNTMWITLSSKSPVEDLSQCEITLQCPAGAQAPQINFTGNNSGNGYKQAYWTFSKDSIKEGEYTVTIKENAEGAPSATATLKVYKVTFNAGEGHEIEGGAGKTHYGSTDSRLPYNFDIGEPTAAESAPFVGWAAEEGKINYSETASTVGGLTRDDRNFTCTAYAAYGVKRNKHLVVSSDPSGDNGTNPGGTIDLGTVEYGTTTPTTLYIVNDGNVNYGEVSVTNGFSHFLVPKLEGGASGAPLPVEGKWTLTLTPKENLKVGSYSGTLQVRGDGAINLYTVKLEVTKQSVQIKASNVTKEYGQTITADQVTLTKDGEAYTLEDGLTLDSVGFAAGAQKGTYDYALKGECPQHDVQFVDDNGHVTVEKADVVGVDINAPEMKVGDKLSACKPSGTFWNEFHQEQYGWEVTGEFKWDEGDDVTLEEPGSMHAWTFTPSDDNHNELHGKTQVKVTAKKPTTIQLVQEETFVYDGQAHGLQFRIRPHEDPELPADTRQVTVTYKLGDQEVERPVDAGTYDVTAEVEEDNTYDGYVWTGKMTIEPRPVQVSVSCAGKTYDGTDNVDVSNITANVTNKVNGNDVTVTVSGRYLDKNVGSKNVAVTLVSLSGARAKNYRIPDNNIVYTTATITAKEITSITPVGGTALTKRYGETLALMPEQFTVAGLVTGESVHDAGLELSSDGTGPEAKVGDHTITATVHSGNYKLGSGAGNAGTITVQKADVTPRLVTAGQGKKGNLLSSVTITGEFVNAHNNAMTVDGKIVWTNEGQTLPEGQETCTADWTFMPNDTDNYNGKTGQASITLSDKTPVQIQGISPVTTEYSGGQQKYPVEGLRTIPSEAAVTVEYKKQIDLAKQAMLMSVGEAWTLEEPKDAGIYDVRLTAVPAYKEEYAATSVQTTFTITKAKPDVSGLGTAAAKQGTALANVAMKAPTGVRGETLTGSFIWAAGDTAVVEKDGQEYHWTFYPGDPNYESVTGSTTITLTDDARKVSAQVFNLPEGDYALVDVEASGLKPGETVMFYKDKNGETAVGVATVSGEGKVRVELNADALSASGGTLWAKITSSVKHTATPVTYLPEIGFTAEPFTTYTQSAMTFTASKSHSSYTATEMKIEGDGLEADAINANSLTASIKGKQAGSTTMTVTVTFAHPDSSVSETISISKVVPVTVLEGAYVPPSSGGSSGGGGGFTPDPSPVPSASPEPSVSPEPGTSPEPSVSPEPGTSPAPEPVPPEPPASGDGWSWSEDGEWYYYENGDLVKNEWRADGGNWNVLGSDGRLLSGLTNVQLGRSDDGWYYLNPVHDGTFGAVLSGWRAVGGSWYFFNDKHDGAYGRMLSGTWKGGGNTWYYLGADGKMLEGLVYVDTDRYDEGLYYFNTTHDGTFGKALVGWRLIDGSWYYFEPRHNGLYGRGYQDGWHSIGGKYYYFYDDGKMAADAVVDGYQIGADGARGQKVNE